MSTAVLAVSATAPLPQPAEAAEVPRIRGICLYVPTLGKAEEFVAMMSKNAPGEWRAEALEGSLDGTYFKTREIYRGARESANTLVGVVDPANFAMIREAVTGSGGGFHYVTYEESGRVTFSVRL